MSRKPRRCPGGLAYHVMNRATARETIFAGEGDYAAFERVLAEAREREAERARMVQPQQAAGGVQCRRAIRVGVNARRGDAARNCWTSGRCLSRRTG